ncbi:hypothetical protein, partial [Chromobacterium vaccinii]|uniref:hypothetical protein n=1 Tax=Chromobacterium vaccinii TaxID=1108595 RepID=UPI001E39C3F6
AGRPAHRLPLRPAGLPHRQDQPNLGEIPEQERRARNSPNYMNVEINFIRQQMDNFYRKIFPSDNAQRNENKKLKAETISISIKAKQEKQKVLKMKA